MDTPYQRGRKAGTMGSGSSFTGWNVPMAQAEFDRGYAETTPNPAYNVATRKPPASF